MSEKCNALVKSIPMDEEMVAEYIKTIFTLCDSTQLSIMILHYIVMLCIYICIHIYV